MKSLVVARTQHEAAPLESALRTRGHEVELELEDPSSSITASSAGASSSLDEGWAQPARTAPPSSERERASPPRPHSSFDLICVLLPSEPAAAVEHVRSRRTLAGTTPLILAVIAEPSNLDPLALLAAGASDFASTSSDLSARIAVLERNTGATTSSNLATHTADELAKKAQAEQRLLASERLTSMGSLAACIAHEINNPLTYVIGNLSYAARGLADLTQGDNTSRSLRLEMALADAREGVERIRRIVGDLTKISQPDHDEEKILDARRVLEASINVAWNEIRHRARLEKSFAEIPLVRANEVRLGQVFLHLLLELSRALPEGPAIDHVLEVETAADDDGNAMIAIRNLRGEGALVSPIAGLGVRISDTIIAGCGGRLIIEGEGTATRTFRVILPAAAAPATAATLAPGAPQLDAGAPALESARPTPGRASILVVDDEPVIASTIRRALEGHEIYIVTSGRDALELCRGHAFDLVLCDLMMPDLTGMDLFEELRRDQNGREKRIIFMTGGAFTDRARKFLNTVPWVEKPFDVDEIQSIVEKYFRRGTELTSQVSDVSATEASRG